MPLKGVFKLLPGYMLEVWDLVPGSAEMATSYLLQHSAVIVEPYSGLSCLPQLPGYV
jgi:hypothetical protein